MAAARSARATYAERRKAEGRPEGRSSRAVQGKPHRDRVLDYWLLPLPTIDPVVVARSGASLAAYGPKFRYSHFAGTKTLRYAVGGAVFPGSVHDRSVLEPGHVPRIGRPAGFGEGRFTSAERLNLRVILGRPIDARNIRGSIDRPARSDCDAGHQREHQPSTCPRARHDAAPTVH